MLNLPLRTTLAAVLMALALPALAIDAEEMFDDPAQEARARDIGRGLRCLVCQNQSIFDSNAELARDLRVVVRERMSEGDTDDEVLDYIHDRFGDYVLLNPPVTTQTYLLWLAPVIFLGLGGVLMVGYLRGRTQVPPEAEPMSDAERDEARRLLGEEKA